MENKSPIKIIFDTDIGNDCDDAGTLAMLHHLCDKGEAELLAVTHCYSNPYFAGCIDAINRYFGREVPVGINYATPRATWGCYAEPLCETFENTYPAEVYGTPDAAPDTKIAGEQVISEELERVPNDKVRSIAAERIRKIKSGERDFRF